MNSLENSAKVWIVKDIPMAHANTNENFLTFKETELNKPEHIGQTIPVITNLIGDDETDHATNSSMNTVGWAKIKGYHDGTLWADAEVTNPQVGEKLERKTSQGRREMGGVSMGARMKKVCSICGGDIEEDGHPHQRGEVYDGQLCTAIADDTKFEHLALTNHFADPNSTLDKSSINALEVACKFDVNKLKVITQTKEVASLPEEIIPVSAPEATIEATNAELLKRIEDLEAQLNEIKGVETSKEDVDEIEEEEADVSENQALPAGDSPEVKAGKAQLPTEITIKIDKKVATEDVKPIAPVAEGSSKMLEKLTHKYKSELATKLAHATGQEANSYMKDSVDALEAKIEVATVMKKNSKSLPEYASFKEQASKKKTGVEQASKRIDNMGTADALKWAYEESTKGGSY